MRRSRLPGTRGTLPRLISRPRGAHTDALNAFTADSSDDNLAARDNATADRNAASKLEKDTHDAYNKLIGA